MKKKSQQELRAAKIRSMQHCFYMDVYSYILAEYKPKIGRLFTNSPIAGNLVDLINQYYWGGNNIPFVAGQVADLLRSKYCNKK